MSTASVVLFVLGALGTLAGIVLVFLGRFDEPPQKEEDSLTVGDVLERFNLVVAKVEKRYRWGIVLLGLGLALIGAGAWLAGLSAQSSPPPPPPPGG